MPTEEEPFDGVPHVEDCDIVSYLVLQTSFISMAQFKARKGLEAYNQFMCGWIKDVSTRKRAGKFLTCGRVSQSHFKRLILTQFRYRFVILNG